MTKHNKTNEKDTFQFVVLDHKKFGFTKKNWNSLVHYTKKKQFNLHKFNTVQSNCSDKSEYYWVIFKLEIKYTFV